MQVTDGGGAVWNWGPLLKWLLEDAQTPPFSGLFRGK